MAKKAEVFEQFIVVDEKVANSVHHGLVVGFGESCPIGHTTTWKDQKAFQFYLSPEKIKAAMAVCAVLDAVFYHVKG